MKDRSRGDRKKHAGNMPGFETNTNPRADPDLRLLVKHSTVAFTSNPELRSRWRRTYVALNGGGYHLLKFVRGEQVSWRLVRAEYSEFCRNRMSLKRGRSRLTPHVIVREASLIALINSSRCPSPSRVFERPSGFEVRTNSRAELTGAMLGLDANRSTFGDIRILAGDARAFLNLVGVPAANSRDEEAVRQILSLVEAFEADAMDHASAAQGAGVSRVENASKDVDLELLVDVDDAESFLFVDDERREERRREQRQRRRWKETEFRNRVLLTLHGQRWFDRWNNAGIVSTRWWAQRVPLLDAGDGTTTLARLRAAINIGSCAQLPSGEIAAKLCSLACPGASERHGPVPLSWFLSERAFDFWCWAEAQVQSAALRDLRLSRFGGNREQ